MNENVFLKMTNMVKPTLYMNGHCKVTCLCGSKLEDGHQQQLDIMGKWIILVVFFLEIANLIEPKLYMNDHCKVRIY